LNDLGAGGHLVRGCSLGWVRPFGTGPGIGNVGPVCEGFGMRLAQDCPMLRVRNRTRLGCRKAAKRATALPSYRPLTNTEGSIYSRGHTYGCWSRGKCG
jgi:hypothetical protein